MSEWVLHVNDWVLHDSYGRDIHFRCSGCGKYRDALWEDICEDCGGKCSWVDYGCLLVIGEK